MKDKPKSLRASVIALIALSVTAVLSVWKLVVEGPTTFVVIPAICLPVATIAWLLTILRFREGTKDRAPGRD